MESNSNGHDCISRPFDRFGYHLKKSPSLPKLNRFFSSSPQVLKSSLLISKHFPGCLESLLCDAGASGAKVGAISLLVTEVGFVISLMLACFARLLGRFGGELLGDWIDMKHF